VSRAVEIRPEAPRRVGDLLEVAAELRWPLGLATLKQGRRQRVWIRVPGELEVSETAVGDALLLATVFGAMRLSGGIRLRGRATAELVDGLGRLQALWSERRPDKYRAVGIECDALEPGVSGDGPALLTFSGGLDSAYSLFMRASAGPRTAGPGLGAALMLHGADIPVEESAAFEEAFARSRRMTDSLGAPLLRAVTNLRVVKQNWSHSSNAALAGVMNLFRGRFGSGLVAVGYTREESLRWWPQDVTDLPLLSSPAFPVVGDGYEADRFQKMDAIHAWPEALANLRVCYRPGCFDRNCGECFKCWIVGFFARLACGKPAPFMPRPVTDADVRAIATCGDPLVLLRLTQLVDHARRRGVRESWVVEAERALAEAGGAVGS